MRWLIFFVTGMLLSNGAKANVDVIVNNSDGVIAVITLITGEVLTTDPESFSRQYQEKTAGVSEEVIAHRFAYLNSPGGNAYAAMRLGRMLRDKNFDAFIFPESVCYSSCVYLLAAGNNKTVHGEVGIHRPYFTELPDSSSSIQEAMRKTLSDSKDYFSQMNIPESLAEEMYSVPPHEIKYLSTSELRSFRLDQKDIIENEISSIDMADRLGVDRRTLLRFYSDIDSQCSIYQIRNDAPSMQDCICRVSRNYPTSIQDQACSGR